MSVTRTPALRHVLRSSVVYTPSVQRRHAQVHDVRFFALHASRQDKVLEKYKDRLEQKAREVGVKSIEELKKVFQQRSPDNNNQPSHSGATPQSSSLFPPTPPAPGIPSPANTVPTPLVPPSQPGVRTLSSILNIPKTLSLPSKEIESIWRLRHASAPQSLCATIPYAVYQRIERTARQHPQFILPLPRPDAGAEIHFLQWTFPTSTTVTVLFTHLAEYKLRGEYAQPHTTVTHHLDLAREKDLVLLEGSVAEGRGVSVEEGRWLLMCLQKFYAGERQETERRRRLLRQFSTGDGDFRVEELVQEAKKTI